MTPRIKRILKFLKKALGLVFLLIVVYVLIVVAEVLWAFQVKLKRWPVYVFGSPYAVQVGDDINKIRLLERLSRLGYVQSPVLVPEPGQWSRSISSLDVNLKHCPVSGLGIVSGPVSITLDWERIRTIHLTRSLEDIERIVLEPELIHIVPAAGWGSILCRPVTLDHVPRLLVDAILLTEDTHFFSHSGIDVESIFKALLANFRAWRYAQGASTITQQLIRMTLLTPKKTLPRKVHEVALSLTAELMYSKEAILEAYLNRVYFGHWGQYSVHGVQEASSYLFGKALRQLDPAECSLIAATIMAPNIITPRRHLERARSRRNMVLGLLFKEGKITRDEYEQGLASELTIQPPGAGPVKAPAFVDLVEDAISRDFQGLGAEHRDVITSLDPVLQNLVNHELRLLGQAGAQTHLILTILKSGWLRAFVEPGTPKWEGKGGNLNVMLPLVMIPALIPEKDGQARFTLTSQFLGPGQSARPVTLREAFTKDRDLLIRRLTETIGVEPVIAVLKEFDVQARPDGQGGVSVEPITPMKMAQIYSLLARLGSVAIISPGIRSPEGAEAASSARTKEVAIAPPSLFLVNHLMKRLQPAEERHWGPEKSRTEPSIFIEKDNDGLWGIAYRSDALLLVRVRDSGLKKDQLLSMMLRVLPDPRTDSESQPLPPDRVVLRKICVDSGLRATSICPEAVHEPFFKGSQPSEWCPIRHEPVPLRSHSR